MHPNLKNLSHSSRDTLHRCPTEYRLYKIGGFAQREDTIDTNFGHAVGAGVQSLLIGESRDEAIWKMFLSWQGDLLSESESSAAKKKKKFFWHAIGAIDNFRLLVNTIFKDWEVAYFNGKPAVELSFRIDFGDQFLDRGHVDVVLRHKVTGELRVLELKTTGFDSINPAMYANSQQGVGYGVVLDAIAKQYPESSSSYEVLYLAYKSKQMEWEPIPFKKTFLQRAQWIKSVLMDIAKIEMYDREGFWPKHGENCIRFTWHECPYFGVCQMSDKSLGIADESKIPVKQDSRDDGKPVEYVFDLHVLDLLGAQLEGEPV